MEQNGYPNPKSAGWVKLHRRLLDHPRFKDPEWLSVWVFLMLSATHTPRQVLFDGRTITLHPGQLITGRDRIAEKTGVNASKVYRVLQWLKTEQQIEQQAGSKSSVITVLNWGMYQKTEQQAEQQSNSSRTAGEQQSNTVQELKERKALEEGARRRLELWQRKKDIEAHIANLEHQKKAIPLPMRDYDPEGHKRATDARAPLLAEMEKCQNALKEITRRLAMEAVDVEVSR